MIQALIHDVARLATTHEDQGKKEFLFKMQVAKVAAISAAILGTAIFGSIGSFFGILFCGALLTVAHDLYTIANNAQNIADGKFTQMNDAPTINAHLFRNAAVARLFAGPYVEETLATSVE